MSSPVVIIMARRKIERGNSSTADVCFDLNTKQQHGRFRLVLIQWNCTFNMPKKMSLKNWKYLEEDATESYVYRQQINISQFKIRSVTQLDNSLHFSAHQFQNNTAGVVSSSHYRCSKMKQEKNKWVIFLTYHFLQHKFELRTIMRRSASYNDILIID